MEVKTEQLDEGTRISVETDQEIAVVVREKDGERIYLPEVSGDDSSYYTEEVESLVPTSEGYSVVHPGNVDNVTVLN